MATALESNGCTHPSRDGDCSGIDIQAREIRRSDAGNTLCRMPCSAGLRVVHVAQIRPKQMAVCLLDAVLESYRAWTALAWIERDPSVFLSRELEN